MTANNHTPTAILTIIFFPPKSTPPIAYAHNLPAITHITLPTTHTTIHSHTPPINTSHPPPFTINSYFSHLPSLP
ncbi:hypothetical protein, partial [Dermacoccus nishinomiyaensis]|uniref:hypothetical protein n=1 Tax=Dermacoccus nishinomiyaensis TaxID=1274 RepID=UPI001C92C8C3